MGVAAFAGTARIIAVVAASTGFLAGHLRARWAAKKVEKGGGYGDVEVKLDFKRHEVETP